MEKSQIGGGKKARQRCSTRCFTGEDGKYSFEVPACSGRTTRHSFGNLASDEISAKLFGIDYWIPATGQFFPQRKRHDPIDKHHCMGIGWNSNMVQILCI